MRRWLVVCALGLSACSVPHVVWEQSAENATTTAALWKIDSAECTGIAMRTVSLPLEPPAQSAPSAQTSIVMNDPAIDELGTPSGQTIAPGSKVETGVIRTAVPSEPAGQGAPAAQTNIAVDLRGIDQPEGGSGQTIAPGSEAETRMIRAAARRAADTERQALSDACMLNRGWVKRDS